MQNFPPNVEELVAEFVLFLPDLITALVVFVLTLIVAGWVRRLVFNALQRREVERKVAQLLAKITRWTVIIFGIITALQQVDFNVTAFITGLGVMGLALGFALQAVTQNFVSGLLLLLQRPFEIGDLIEVEDFIGWVEEIDLRATRLKTLDGQDVLIPNSEVFTNPLTNHTHAPLQRVELGVGVAYDSDLEKAAEAAVNAIESIPYVLDEPAPPQVNFHTFGGSSINLTVYYWINNLEQRPRIAIDDGVRAIKRAFNASGIEIPFPIRTVHMKREDQAA
ncbi:MAG: mechanosensitive ion channel [Anaerolineales bacterium]|nr:mechanosensitive ion channel [Anaerolineales bacterium]